MTAPLLNKSPNKSVNPWWGERTFTETKGDRHAVRHTVAYRPLEGSSVSIIGGGPGLCRAAASMLAMHRAIAVNNSFLFLPAPAMVVALDRRWWSWHGNDTKARQDTCITSLQKNQTNPAGFTGYAFNKDRATIYDPDPGILCGQNSGHAAITLAMHLGAARIYLAGFDMGFKGERTHWHGGHNVPSSSANYQRRFRPALEALAKVAPDHGVSIMACTPTYADIPTCSLDQALEDLRQ